MSTKKENLAKTNNEEFHYSKEEEEKAILTFLIFLYQQNLLSPTLTLQPTQTNDPNETLQKLSIYYQNNKRHFPNLVQTIQYFFHKFTEPLLKLIISQAIEYRNQQLAKEKSGGSSSNSSSGNEESATVLFGDWSMIMDSMKFVLEQRRHLATQHFQQLISYGMEGKSETVRFYLQELSHNGYLDYLFLAILKETITTLQQKGLTEEDNYYMLTYFQQVINELQEKEEEKEKETMKASQEKLEKLNLNNNKEKETKNKSSNSTNSGSFQEEDLVFYSHLLNTLIKESQGNISQLQDKLIHKIENHVPPPHHSSPSSSSTTTTPSVFPFDLFLYVIEENLRACQQANYANKVKLLQFLEKFVKNYQQQKTNEKEQITQILHDNDIDKTAASLSTYHAPQFIDQTNNPNNNRLTKIMNYPMIFNAQHLVFNEHAIHSTIAIPSNPKKRKAFRKQMKARKIAFFHEVNSFLYEHGWVVIDNILPLDLVKRVRIESNLFRHFYDQAEIWVGKKADVGAHITVPSVRGDRVLWVCGGHNVLNPDHNPADESDDEQEDFMKKGYKPNHYAPEGLSRVVKTIGDIEPCKLEVKAAAPIRKFAAIKDAVTCVDKMVEEFKLYKDEKHNNHLNTIYERSDGMLSIYPGEGARFANHIDNTTQDGRKITVVTYLNPNWTDEMGGQIRVRPKRHNYTPSSEETKGVSPVEIEGEETNKAVDKKSAKVESEKSAPVYPPFGEYDGIDIYPIAGRAIIFFSSQIEHEVMPTFGDRHALTIWYYDKHERKEALERAQKEGLVQKVSAASVEKQQEAKAFIAELMGGDEVGEDGGNPTLDELQLLTKKVETLTDDALEIIAGITGAPSIQSFREGFPMLTVQDLKSMRALFRRMGLQN